MRTLGVWELEQGFCKGNITQVDQEMLLLNCEPGIFIEAGSNWTQLLGELTTISLMVWTQIWTSLISRIVGFFPSFYSSPLSAWNFPGLILPHYYFFNIFGNTITSFRDHYSNSSIIKAGRRPLEPRERHKSVHESLKYPIYPISKTERFSH